MNYKELSLDKFMIIAALKSPDATDLRSVIHPETLSKLIELEGTSMMFESGIGKGINVSDEALTTLGLICSSRDECLNKGNVIITPSPLTSSETSQIQPGASVIGMLNPFYAQDELKAMAAAKLNAVSMEFIPRITRAQKMDVLSSQANLAGYAAVLEAAQHLNSALPMMMTAAGTLKPARVFVIGVGVAGLQAIATAKRLGARVEAFDTRDVVEEQVKSLGAKFVKIDLGETGQTDQGYAKELTEEQIAKQRNCKVWFVQDLILSLLPLRYLGDQRQGLLMKPPLRK